MEAVAHDTVRAQEPQGLVSQGGRVAPWLCMCWRRYLGSGGLAVLLRVEFFSARAVRRALEPRWDNVVCDATPQRARGWVRSEECVSRVLVVRLHPLAPAAGDPNNESA